jgi:hypothetical protein
MGSEVTKVTGNDTRNAPVTSAVTQTSHLPQDGSIPSGPAFSKTPETDNAWENNHPLYRFSDNEKRELCAKFETQNKQLKTALAMASKWGIRSDGFSGEVSDSLRVWIDGGMIGDTPQIPDYYP